MVDEDAMEFDVIHLGKTVPVTDKQQQVILVADPDLMGQEDMQRK